MVLKVVYKKPNEKAHELEIEDTLEKLQELVDGYIEVIPMDDIFMIVNEEGNLRGLQPNIFVGEKAIVGNVIFALNKGDDEIHSLLDNIAKSIIKMLN